MKNINKKITLLFTILTYIIFTFNTSVFGNFSQEEKEEEIIGECLLNNDVDDFGNKKYGADFSVNKLYFDFQDENFKSKCLGKKVKIKIKWVSEDTFIVLDKKIISEQQNNTCIKSKKDNIEINLDKKIKQDKDSFIKNKNKKEENKEKDKENNKEKNIKEYTEENTKENKKERKILKEKLIDEDIFLLKDYSEQKDLIFNELNKTFYKINDEILNFKR